MKPIGLQTNWPKSNSTQIVIKFNSNNLATNPQIMQISARFERATSDIKVKVYDTSDNVWSSENLKSVQPAPMPKLDADATSKLGIKQTATHLLSGTRTKMSVQQADVTEKPYSAMGKLLFMDTAGNHYECSGQFIDVNLVLTAGHCVYSLETNGWNKHFKFIQQYVGDVTGLRTSNFKGISRR